MIYNATVVQISAQNEKAGSGSAPSTSHTQIVTSASTDHSCSLLAVRFCQSEFTASLTCVSSQLTAAEGAKTNNKADPLLTSSLSSTTAQTVRYTNLQQLVQMHTAGRISKCPEEPISNTHRKSFKCTEGQMLVSFRAKSAATVLTFQTISLIQTISLKVCCVLFHFYMQPDFSQALAQQKAAQLNS